MLLLATELLETRRSLETLCGAHASARRRVDELRRALAHHHRAKKKPSGKKQKLSPTQQAKVQEMAEQLGELTTLLNNAAKEVQESEKQVNDCSRRLQHCERELSEARAMQGKSDRSSMEQAAMLHKQQQLQQQQHQQLQQQQQLQHEQQLQLQLLEMEKQKLERQKQAALVNSASGSGAGIVRVRRMPGDGAVTAPPAAQHLLPSTRHLTVLNVCDEPQPKPQAEKKQTWEQALAHMNQLAKGSAKEKKKKEQPKPEPMKEPQRSQSLPDATQPLSKKQRKLLAKQQSEEEEKKKQAQEAKAKRQEAKKEPAKPEPVSKKDKKENKKVEPPAMKKKEEKKDNKKEKTEKKGKENKQEKNAPAPAAKAKQQPAQQPSKKEKKKEQQKPQVINITPDTTIEVVNKKNAHTNELDKPASCSIMEQLSCGVQVADLRLPPGITLTRVQPTEQKERPTIKSVPLWKSSQLPAAPTPVARPPPVINADPNMMMFTTALPEAPKTIINAEPPPPPPAAKSKKAKKKAKKAAAAAETDPKTDGTKMVTLRNPMFHPNLPPVQVSSTQAPKKPEQIRIPDPIPMPPNACQATITPTSNGMYTIRNPLMSMMHQQTMMGMRNPSPQLNPMFGQQQYNYVNPNVYNPVPVPPQTYVLDPRASPKDTEFQNRIMNLASFTQKNDEGYSLFKTSEDNQQRNFLTPEFYDDPSPKPIVSPNPIGTRPNNDSNRSFDSDSSLFANPIQRPEPIGTPLKRDESDFGSLYTPFGQEDRNVFRNALFNDKNESVKMEEMGSSQMANGDPLPYFQRLRVGSKLNNEVTIHHVTESKFYKGQEPPQEAARAEESLFSGAAPPGGAGAGGAWSDGLYTLVSPASLNNKTAALSGRSSPTGSSLCSSGGSSPPTDDAGFGAVGTRAQPAQESSVFLPDRSITNLSTLEVSEREIESFKRFDFYFEPPQHKPKVQLDVRDIAAALRHNHK